MTQTNNAIECAIIHVDNGDKSNSIANYGRSFCIRVKDIEETMKFIKGVYEELNIPFSRIYISGFTLSTESFIWTKKRILESIKFDEIHRMAINNIGMTR